MTLVKRHDACFLSLFNDSREFVILPPNLNRQRKQEHAISGLAYLNTSRNICQKRNSTILVGQNRLTKDDLRAECNKPTTKTFSRRSCHPLHCRRTSTGRLGNKHVYARHRQFHGNANKLIIASPVANTAKCWSTGLCMRLVSKLQCTTWRCEPRNVRRTSAGKVGLHCIRCAKSLKGSCATKVRRALTGLTLKNSQYEHNHGSQVFFFLQWPTPYVSRCRKLHPRLRRVASFQDQQHNEAAKYTRKN